MLTDNEQLNYYRRWLESYPFTTPRGGPLNIDISQIQDSALLTNDEGNALRFISKAKRDVPFVGGGGEQIWTNGFLFISWRRYMGDDTQRELNDEFFNQFTIWINEQNTNRFNPDLAPLFPWFSTNGKTDIIRAAYNGEVAIIDNTQMEYHISMVHTYETRY